MSRFILPVKLIHANAKLPLVNSETGRITLYTCTDVGGNTVWLPSNSSTRIHTGVELQIPAGYVGIMSTSQNRLDNLLISQFPACSILDEGITGEIIINVANFSENVVCIKDGEPLVDIVLQSAVNNFSLQVENTIKDRQDNIPR